MLTKLRTVVYPAQALAEGKAFYAGLLGQPPYFDEPFYVGFNVHGAELGLVPDAPVAGQAGPIAYWSVDDIEAAVAHALSLGASLFKAPYSVGEGTTVAEVQDPCGNLLGFIHEQPAAPQS